MKHKPPMARSVVREMFHLSGSATPWTAKALAGFLFVAVLGLPLAAHSPGATDAGPVLPSPLEPAVPLQEWTVDAGTLPYFASVVLGRLPQPDPRQRRPPCATRMGEEAINGVCWLRLDVDPPCPQDPGATAYEHGGKCYAFALHAARTPTSGDVYPVNLANP